MRQKLVLLTLTVFFATLRSASPTEDARGTAKVDFARDILPVLSNKCFVCHGPDAKKKKILRLDSRAGATRDLGGYRAIDPDAPEKSQILVRIHDADDPMPPKKAEKQLTARERDLIDRWARQGGEYATHWAFVPPKKSPTAKKDANESEIDAFVRTRRDAASIAPASEADRTTLARRVAFVLTGLPPEPEQLAAFIADKRSDAYSRLVDQLLSSSYFGEHQARYWLDAVRYGDTHGLHLDNKRGIYPYRDWVVHAFNSNLPLDDFITWQLAGDLLPNPTLAQKVATGFVRMNPSTAEGGAIPAEFQAKNNFDRTEALGTVLLGMSLICARCHTHKFDPIPQTEYYRLLAFFNSTAEKAMDGNSYTYGPTIKAPKNQAAWIRWRQLGESRKELLSKAETEITARLSEADAKKWATSSPQDRLKFLESEAGPFATLKLQRDAKDIAAGFAKTSADFTTTLVAQDLKKPRKTHVLERGEYNLPIGDALEPGILNVMGTFPADAPRNRLGLARWLTSREHPLVARVLMNRLWQRTFGDGLVRTPEDFGLQGEQPTHPKLLDWLAVELMDSGWDMKHMLRLLVTSRTFRQSSAWRRDVDDPENRLLARGPSHRLDAEVIRDLALWASGLLAKDMGGEGVKPYQPGGLWKALAHPGSNTKKYERDKGQKLYRRSIYVYWKRTSPHPMMTLFDAPSRETSCVKRSRTSTSLQSLGLFNETQRIEMSRKLAERLLHEAKDDTSRLNLLFTLIACRKPNDRERAVCEKLLGTLRARYEGAEKDALALLSVGEAPRDEKLDPAEQAAWSQLAVTLLATDVAIYLY
jgi:mono/diheme cytochrome c family protein